MVKSFLSIIIISAVFITGSAHAANAENGKTKAALCAACHGADGISISTDIPNLAGQKVGYLAKAIRDFKSGTRKNPLMSTVVPLIADADIEDIAAFYSSIK